MDVKRVAVIGAGEMGHGIAELAALRGFTVVLNDVKRDVLDKAMGKIEWSLGKLVEKNQVTKLQADEARRRIVAQADLGAAVKDADMVIEAVPERLDLKQDLFARLENMAPKHAVLATNTSGMRISEIAAKTTEPGRVVGMHFFNPVLLMDLVEVVRGERTSPASVQAAVDVSKKLGKTVVVCEKDVAGFITTRLVGALVNTAAWMVHHGECDVREVDSAFRNREGFPMGPLELSDYTGIDVNVHVGEYLSSRLGPEYANCPLLNEKAKAGQLGMKTGRGFYDWSKGRPDIPRDLGSGVDTAKVWSVIANEAAKLVEQGVATPDQIDLAMKHATAFPKGPCAWADEYGLDQVVGKLTEMETTWRSRAVSPARLLLQKVAKGETGKKAGKGFYEHSGNGGGGASGMYETVLVNVDKEARIGTITLNRPHRLNTIVPELMDDMLRATIQLERDPDVRCIVITGAGEKVFCAGADVTQFTSGGTPAEAQEMLRRMHLVLNRIEQSPKPVVAAVNGHALGGGLEIALACDFRVAAEKADLGLVETKLGLIPGAGGTQRLPRVVGIPKAKEMIFFGQRIPAKEAKAIGLVTEVYATPEFAAKSKEFALKLAKGPPIALRLAKQAIHAAMHSPIEIGTEVEAAAFGVVASTEDVVEGVSSFMAKKEPDFKGR